MRKRILSVFLAVVMVVGLMPGFTLTAMAMGEVTLLVNTSAADDNATRGVGAQYKTLAGAVTKATSGDTIKFETNCTIGETVLIEGKTLTLDLNDKLITCDVNTTFTYYAINVGNGGTLTVTDTANGLGKIQYSTPIVTTSNGTVNVARGTIEANSAGKGPAIQNSTIDATINVSGGTVSLDIGGSESYGAINNHLGTVNVSGGTVVGTGNTPAIKSSGTVNVTGGSINLLRIYSGCTAYVTGGNINTIYNDGTLQNLNSQSLCLYTFIGGDPDVAVSSLSVTPALGYTYGLNDVKTDGNGKIYVWLPTGITNASVTAGGKTMTIDFRIRGEEITGLRLPSPGMYGQMTDFSGNGYTGYVTSWSPSATPFLPGTVYTGTIKLTVVDSYTFTGMTGTFTMSGVTSVIASDNTGNTLKLTVVFPETESPKAVTVAVKKDGGAWTGHGKSFALFKDGFSNYDLDSSGYNASVLPGTYDIYDGSTDTGVDITVSKDGANTATVNYYTVTFRNDDDTSTLNTQIVLSGKTASYGGTMPTKTADAQYSYVFSKWVTTKNGTIESALSNITAAKIVYASFAPTLQSYTITWKKDSTTTIHTVTVAYGVIPTHTAPDNTGYTFNVWTPDITSVTGNATYTAIWTADSYNITYQLNGGNVSAVNPVSYTIDSAAITLNNPTREGYSFVGWSGTDLTGNTNQSVAIPTGSTGVKSYIANWKADKPSVPEASVVTAKTSTTLTISTIVGYEYRLDGTSWHSGTSGSYTFAELIAGHTYSLVCRKAEVTTIGSASAASDASEALPVTTKNSAPATPTAEISSFTTNKITMNEVTGGAYSKDGGVTWQDSNEFTGLTPATKYTFAVRINENETTMASATSATVDQYTVPSTPLAGEGYTIDYSAETIAITSGYEVSTTSDFSTVLTSGGAVVPGTTYYIRKAINNLTTPATPASDYISFATPLRPEIPTVSAVNETISGKNDGKITDVTTAMEWKIIGGTYAVIAANQVSNGVTDLVDDTYYVRVKAVDNISFASAAQEIIISTGHSITVTFDSKSGSDVSQITGKSYGDKITEIVTTPTLSGYNFAGWYKEADCTNVWTFTIDTLTDNITLYAKWSAVPTYTVTGTIVDDVSPAAIVIDANVKLMKGTTQFGTTGMTDANGDFFINNVPSGTYNLVITKGTKTATILVQVSGGNVAVGNAVLPSGNANSILVINGSGTPDIVVGGLNTEANTQLGANTRVVITMMVEEKEASAAANGTEVSAAITSAGKQVGMILDIILSSSVNGGITTTVAETSNLIEIIVPIPTELQNKATYAVYRYHGTGTDVISETENADHEKIIVDRTNWTITLYVKKFSTYAIGYVNPTSGGGGGSSSSGQNITAPAGLPYYIDANGNEVFVGFASDESGTMKYIVPTNAKVLFKANTKSFTDNTITWAKASINFVTERELFLGTSQDTFSPNESMTRAMFVTVIGRLYERSYGSVSGTSTFSDVNANAYYAKYVAWANENGIIKGIGENQFAPEAKVTREQMAVIMLNFADFLNKADVADSSLVYADGQSISSWAMDGAKYCQETKVITGRDGGIFAPQESATRAEVAAVINRFINTIVK